MDNETVNIPRPDRSGAYLPLRGTALTALTWWEHSTTQFAAPGGEPTAADRRAAADLEKGASPTLAALINTARRHVAGNPDDYSARRWRLAEALAEHLDRLQPIQQVIQVPAAESDRCGHGWLFSEPCDGCEA